MALRVPERATETIEYAEGKGSVTVRGLTFIEISEILDPLSTQIAAAFDTAIAGDPRDLLNDERYISQVVGILLRVAPVVMVQAIAIAADARDQEEEVAKLPVDVTIAAVEKIAHLTFDDGASLVGITKRIGNFASAKSRAVSGKRQ